MTIINEKKPTDLKTADFYYDLPERLIAQHPSEKRDHSRLMVLDRKNGGIEHKHFYDILDYLREGDVLVINDSKVIPARLYGHAEGREDAARKAFSLIVYVTIVSGILLVILGEIILEPTAKLLGAEGEMLSYCLRYGRILIINHKKYYGNDFNNLIRKRFKVFLINV